MNTARREIGRLALGLAMLVTGASKVCAADFVFKGSYTDEDGYLVENSYIAPIQDQEMIDEARALLTGEKVYSYVFKARIDVCDQAANFDICAPGRRSWSWCVAEVIGFLDITNLRLNTDLPIYGSNPAEIEEDPANWIAENGNTIAFVSYRLAAELTSESNHINVSARGNAGSGHDVLIGGFVVDEGNPKVVLIRGLGPSLASEGGPEFMANPQIKVFRNGQPFASNDDWQEQSMAHLDRVADFFLPKDPVESALVLCLGPGRYTVHLQAAPDTESGIGLLDVFDLAAFE